MMSDTSGQDDNALISSQVILTDKIAEQQTQIADLKAGMREIYEVWAGSEEFKLDTPLEMYQKRLIEDMRDIASRFL